MQKHKKTASVTYRFTELLSTEAEVIYGCTRVENPSSLHAYGIQDNLPKLIMTVVSKNLSNGILLTSAPQLQIISSYKRMQTARANLQGFLRKR